MSSPLPWYQRLNVMNVTLILFLLAVVFSSGSLRGSGRDLDYAANFWNFLSRFFPPDVTVLPDVMASLVETFQIAVMATFFSVLLSIPLAAAGAQNIAPRWLVVLVRMVLNLVRAIPSLIWALIAVALVGLNPLAGVIALTFYSLGYLGKFFSDAYESVDAGVARGLRAIGAGTIQAFQFGLWPHAKPLIWSHALWMLEYNIRSATIIGYVGAGGIGSRLHEYQEYGRMDRFGMVILVILVVVTLLDFLGEWIRTRIKRRTRLRSIADT
jgi:phosphonate transport system permease protein